MEKKQTALEFYREELNALVSFRETKFKTEQEIFDQAKAMHKEEIVKASAQGYILGADGFPLEVAHHYGQQWYKNQFEGGEDE